MKRTNVDGTLELTAALLPCLANDARIINVSSSLGQVADMPGTTYTMLARQAHSLEDIISAGFVDDGVTGSKFCAPYSVSKLLLNRATQI